MLRATSIVNFLNQANFLAIDQKSQNVIWRFNANSFKLWLSHSSKNFDSFNKGSPAYKYVHYDRGVKNFFFKNCFIVQWARIAFRGKSFRIRNFCAKNKFTLNFGYSHWTRLKLLDRWAFYKKRRQSYVIFTWSYKDFCYFSRFFPYIRFYNKYTMRGLRLKRQHIIRRFGKISQHISSLH